MCNFAVTSFNLLVRTQGFPSDHFFSALAMCAVLQGGKKVQVKYIGRLKSNNKVFDQTKGNKTFSFRLGVGEVIKVSRSGYWDKLYILYMCHVMLTLSTACVGLVKPDRWKGHEAYESKDSCNRDNPSLNTLKSCYSLIEKAEAPSGKFGTAALVGLEIVVSTDEIPSVSAGCHVTGINAGLNQSRWRTTVRGLACGKNDNFYISQQKFNKTGIGYIIDYVRTISERTDI